MTVVTKLTFKFDNLAALICIAFIWLNLLNKWLLETKAAKI